MSGEAKKGKRRSRNGIGGTVYQRGKKWAYMLDVGVDELTGKRKQQAKSGFDTEDDAWDALVEANNRVKSNKYVKPSKRTVRQFFDEWLPAAKMSLGATTHANYKRYAYSYVVPIIGHRKLQDVANSSETITKLLSHLKERGRVKGDSNQRMHECWKNRTEAGDEPTIKELAEVGGVTHDAAYKARRRYRAGRVPTKYTTELEDTTIRSIRIMLGRAFGDAVDWKYIAENPVPDSANVRLRRKKHQTWTPEQLKDFLAEAKHERLYAMWLMFATTGVRRSEAAGALRERLDVARKIISVYETRLVADGEAVDGDGKSDDSRRELALDKRTLAELGRHIEMLDNEREELRQAGKKYHDGGYLFCWSDGRPIHPDTITEQFNRIVDRAGVPLIKLHDVRHTYATMCLRAGIDPKIVSARLGHASVAFTLQTYTEDVPELHHLAAEKVSGLFLDDDETDDADEPQIDVA